MPTPKLYLIDENKNLVEVENIDENLYSTILAKIHSNLNNTDHFIEFVTQAQYNQLVAGDDLVPNTYYFITDDTTEEDLVNAINQLANNLQELTEADKKNYRKVDGGSSPNENEAINKAFNYFNDNDNKQVDIYETYYEQSPKKVYYKFIRGGFASEEGAKSMLAFVTTYISLYAGTWYNSVYLITWYENTLVKKTLATKEDLQSGDLVPLKATNSDNATYSTRAGSSDNSEKADKIKYKAYAINLNIPTNTNKFTIKTGLTSQQLADYLNFLLITNTTDLSGGYRLEQFHTLGDFCWIKIDDTHSLKVSFEAQQDETWTLFGQMNLALSNHKIQTLIVYKDIISN